MKQLTKKLLIALVFTATTIYADVPASHTNVKTDTSLDTMLQSYEKVILSGDTAKAFDFTYPKVFDTIPKEQLIQIKKQQENNGAPKPKITSIKQTPVLPVKKYSKGTYTLVNYVMDMRMNMAQPGKEDEMNKMLKDPKKLASFQNFMKSLLATALSKDATIEFEKNSFIANIHQKSSYIAINEENKGYKMVELSTPTAGRLDKILPKEIYDTYKSQIDTLKVEAENKMKALMGAMGAQ